MSNTSILRYPSKDDCPDATRLHTPCPSGYFEWHEWAREKAKTHKSERCPTCGYYSVWKPKRKRAAAVSGRESGDA